MTAFSRKHPDPNAGSSTSNFMSETTQTQQIRAAWEAAGMNSGALQTLRSAALTEFERNGLPHKRLENWKYTDVRELNETLPRWLGNTIDSAAAPASRELAVADALKVFVVDGVFAADLSDTLIGARGLPDNVILGDIAELAASNPQLLERLGTLSTDSGFVALSNAFAGNGTALLVPDDIQLARPVSITYLSTQAEIVAQPRLLVHLGVNASATVVEHYASATPGIVNPVAELFCDQGARLTYYKLQDEDLRNWHTAAQYAAVARDATLLTTHVDVGANLSRNDLKIDLLGSGAHAECKGLFMADGHRHVESRLDVNHRAPDTTSRERFRGILAGQARGVFNGRIYVDETAQKTFAELTNRNLLLSKGAEINSKPELEIYADDVKCAHGSTTGQLDANSLFYLLTRGVDPATARAMLVTAFAAELLTGMTVPAIAERAQQALETLQTEGTGS